MMAKSSHVAVLIAALLLAAAPAAMGAAHELPTDPGDESAQSGNGGKPYVSKIPTAISGQVLPLLDGYFPEDKVDAAKAVIATPEMDTQVFNVLAKYCYEDQDFAAYKDGMAVAIMDIAELAGTELNGQMSKEQVEGTLANFQAAMSLMCRIMPPKPMCNATQAEVLSACPFYTPDIMDVWLSGVPPETAIFADLGTVCMAENCTTAISESGCFDMEAVITPVMGLCGCHAKLIESNGECGSVLAGTAAAFVGAVESVSMSLATGSYDADSPAAMTLKEASGICPAEDGTNSTCMTAMMGIQECAALEEEMLEPATSAVCCVLGVADEPKCGAMLASFASMDSMAPEEMGMNSPAMGAMLLMADPNTSTEEKVKEIEDLGFDTYGKLMTGMYTSVCDMFDYSAFETCAPKMTCLDTLGDDDMMSGRRLMAGHEGKGDDMDDPGLAEGMEQLQMLCDPEACGTKILEECLSIPMAPMINMSMMMGDDMMSGLSGRRLLEHRRSLLAGHEMPNKGLLLEILDPLIELMTEEGEGATYDTAKELGPEILSGMCRQQCYDAITSCTGKPDLFMLGDNSKVEPTCAEIEPTLGGEDDDESSAVSAAARFAPALLAAAAALAMA